MPSIPNNHQYASIKTPSTPDIKQYVKRHNNKIPIESKVWQPKKYLVSQSINNTLTIEV